jgi:hypothetical protein
MTIDRILLKALVKKGSDDDLHREMSNCMMNLEVESLAVRAHSERPVSPSTSATAIERAWETRVGTVELESPKLRMGS